MVAEARPTPPSLTSISPSSSALNLQPIGRPPNLFSPSPNLPSSLSTLPVHPNHHDLYPRYHHPTHPHHDHLSYPNHRPPNQQGQSMAGLPYPSHLNYRSLLNTPSPPHLSSHSWAHLTPLKTTGAAVWNHGLSENTKARQVVRRQFLNMFY